MSQITTLSRPSGSKAAYKPWQKEEVERPIGWIEEYVDLMHGKRSEWAERAEGVFSASLGVALVRGGFGVGLGVCGWRATKRSRCNFGQDGDLPRKVSSRLFGTDLRSASGGRVECGVRWNMEWGRMEYGIRNQYNDTCTSRFTGTRYQVICVLFQHYPHWHRGYIVPLQSADMSDAMDGLHHSAERS